MGGSAARLRRKAKSRQHRRGGKCARREDNNFLDHQGTAKVRRILSEGSARSLTSLRVACAIRNAAAREQNSSDYAADDELERSGPFSGKRVQSSVLFSPSTPLSQENAASNKNLMISPSTTPLNELARRSGGKHKFGRAPWTLHDSLLDSPSDKVLHQCSFRRSNDDTNAMDNDMRSVKSAFSVLHLGEVREEDEAADDIEPLRILPAKDVCPCPFPLNRKLCAEWPRRQIQIQEGSERFEQSDGNANESTADDGVNPAASASPDSPPVVLTGMREYVERILRENSGGENNNQDAKMLAARC